MWAWKIGRKILDDVAVNKERINLRNGDCTYTKGKEKRTESQTVQENPTVATKRQLSWWNVMS